MLEIIQRGDGNVSGRVSEVGSKRNLIKKEEWSSSQVSFGKLGRE